jgi:hypothetical protein
MSVDLQYKLKRRPYLVVIIIVRHRGVVGSLLKPNNGNGLVQIITLDCMKRFTLLVRSPQGQHQRKAELLLYNLHVSYVV